MLDKIVESIEGIDSKTTKKFVQEALDSGINPKIILDEGLSKGMSIIGKKFKKGEIYIPEVLMAAENMKSGMEVLKPLLAASNIRALGKVVIGTVKGDLHDIGKNIVTMMLVGAGFEVYDIGIDKDEEEFSKAVSKYTPDILGMSALLTTTMSEMEKVIDRLKKENLRENLKIFIGGAPVTKEYADQIGADYYCEDATTAAETAKSIINKKT